MQSFLLTCLVSKAVHADAVSDCSTGEFRQTFKQIVGFRRYPEVVHFYSGTQLGGIYKGIWHYGDKRVLIPRSIR